MTARILAAGCAGLVILGCASVQPVSYSLRDGEIFIAPRPHFFNAAVAVLEDRRSPEERSWAAQQNLPSNLAEMVTEQMVQHLRVSHVFHQIQRLSEPFNPYSSDGVRKLRSQGIDAVLFGELVHFHGQSGSDRQIEGNVQFANLKLVGTWTGQLLWEGTADKLLRRQEKEPGRARDYAAEALRGAVNQLAIQLADQSISRLKVYSSDQPETRHWRVGVLLPDDARPPEEKDVQARMLQGDPNYSLYSDPARRTDMLNDVPDQWAEKLQAAEIFGETLSIHRQGTKPENLKKWSEEGLDAVLASRLTRLFGLVVPPRDEKPFPILSGGMGYPRVFKGTAFTRIEDVQLIETRSGKILWTGEAEDGIDRTIKTWESPVKLVQESLGITLDRLVKQLSETRLGVPVVVVETPPVKPAPKTEPLQEQAPIAKATEAAAPEARTLADIFFDFNKYLIRDDMRPILEENARWLEDHPGVKIRIEGHCDERGTTDYNLALGERRAKTVQKILKVFGIDDARLSTLSYGEEHPVCTEHDEDCYAKNRRVHLEIQ
jgi:peptidoglycan-associated lipoprotein